MREKRVRSCPEIRTLSIISSPFSTTYPLNASQGRKRRNPPGEAA